MGYYQKTIHEAFWESVWKDPAHPAIVHIEDSKEYTYQRLKEEASSLAKAFLAYGIGPKDTVALLADNVAEWMHIWLALSEIGSILVPLDPGLDPHEIGYILSDAGVKAVISIQSGIPKLEASGWDPERSLVIEKLNDLIASDGPFSGPATIPTPTDPVAIMYTSGTTGRPKGVVLDHLGLVNKSLASMERQRIDHRDRLCLFFPLFHMFGNTCIALSGLLVGATLVMPSKSFDPGKVLAAMADWAVTAVFGSPSMFLALLEHPNSTKEVWRTVKKGTIGGASCPPELMKRLVVEMEVTGIVTAYGITEASSWITMTDPEDSLEEKLRTVGSALPCCEVRIIDQGTGEELAPNRQGEVVTRGFLMKGYHNLEKATNQAIDQEGWFHTGDLGYMDEKGYLRISGRLKEVIVRGQEEILPLEIEEVFYKMPKVAEAYAFGVYDPQKGQELALVARPKEGVSLIPEDLWEFAKQHLPTLRRPRYYGISEELPKTKSGKIQRFRLKGIFDLSTFKSFEDP